MPGKKLLISSRWSANKHWSLRKTTKVNLIS